jgi:hypothetical protein
MLFQAPSVVRAGFGQSIERCQRLRLLRLRRKRGDIRAILKAMIDQRPWPTFTPRPVRDEWYIHVEWPDGRFEPIQHFQSESEAQHWIVENSERWLRVRGFIL